jgi:hypothetical protein
LYPAETVGAGKTVKSTRMLKLAAVPPDRLAKSGQPVAAQLPGGLKREIVMLAKKGQKPVHRHEDHKMTAAGATPSILLFGPPSAFDNVEHTYEYKTVTGVAFCPGPDTNPPAFRLCVGLPRVDESKLFPLQGCSDGEPGKSSTSPECAQSGPAGTIAGKAS